MNKIFLKEIIEKPITGEWGKEGNDVKVLRTTNFSNNGSLKLESIIKRSIPKHKIEKKKLCKGDIIIEKSGGSPKQPVGRVVFFDIDGVYLCNNFTAVLRPKTKKTFPKYLHYLLFASHKFNVTEIFQNKTTGIINLQLSRYIEKLQIPLPPIETQKQIAQILDDAAALRDKTQQLLNEYDQLAQSIFLDMFGDHNKYFKDFLGNNIKLLNSKRIPVKKSDRINMNGEYPYYGASGIIDYVDDFLFNEETLLIGEDGANLISRSTPIAFRAKGKYWVNNHAHVISQKSSLNIIYLEYFINSINLETYITGSAQPKLNSSNLKKVELPIPDIKLQNQFAKKIDLIEQQKDLAKQELQESEDLFQALLQKAFKGELV